MPSEALAHHPGLGYSVVTLSDRALMDGAGKVGSSRPTAAERRSRILRAAADVFFEHGFAASSIDMIIAKIGGSKRAIYTEFGNKEALFAALVTELADEILVPLHDPNSSDPTDLRSALLRVAERLTAAYASKDLIGIYLVIVTEAYRFPHLAQAYYDKGPGRAARELKTVLDAAVRDGEIRPVDTAAAADHFVGLVRDNFHLQVVLGLRDAPKQQDLLRRASGAVEIFLTGVALDPADERPSRDKRKEPVN